MGLNEVGPQWSVDSLLIRDSGLFCYGWCAESGQRFVGAELLLEYPSGALETVRVQYGVHRPDVTANFSHLPSACGFFVHATLARSEAASAVWLLAHRSDGTLARLKCPLPVQAQSDSESGGAGGLVWSSLLMDILRMPWMLLRGEWRVVWRGVKMRRALLRSPSSDKSTVRRVFEGLRADTLLIFDHSLGGGANQFRAGLVRSCTEAGREVVVWTFVLHLLQYEVNIYSGPDAPVRRMHVPWRAWQWLLASRKVGEVVFNNCVGFPRQEEMPGVLMAFRQQGGARLRVYLHDFHMVCPSHFLLNDEGRFCGVPKHLAQCRQCLPRINDGLAGLFAARNIDLWRQRWGDMLQVADEVVHFSRSSRELLSRAYPAVREVQWVLRPHQIAPAKGRFHYPKGKAGVRVAVVGHIGRHKGSGVVLDLVRQARQEQVPLEVVVIGTLDTADETIAITQTGSYQHDALAELLDGQEVHLALMPSICPETFSYVTHELMQLGVPLISFTLGAQAEAVSAYDRGRVLPLGSPRELLRQIQEFKDELDARELP